MDRAALARELAEESVVLLKNEGSLLPLKRGSRLAVFGRAQIETIYSGNGSGAASVDGGLCILEALKASFQTAPLVEEYYRREIALHPAPKPFDWTNVPRGNSGLMYEIFGQYRPPVPECVPPEEVIASARAIADTAIIVLGRNAGGEECDRRLQGDYLLSENEKALFGAVCASFERIVLVLNLNGAVDLSILKELSAVRSVLFLGIPGEQGTNALVSLLTGEREPSGKLAFTLARNYEDYPSAHDFSFEREKAKVYADYGLDAEGNGSTGFAISPVTVYSEGVFLGYRYFDAFHVEPLFSFGFGLGYTSFAVKTLSVEEGNALSLRIRVKNTGNFYGKETIQVYLQGYNRSVFPKKLAAFHKTKRLAPAESEVVTISLDWEQLCVYDEERSLDVIEAGKYVLFVGTSVKDVRAELLVEVPGELVVRRLSRRLSLRGCNKDLIFLHEAPPSRIPEAPRRIIMRELPSEGGTTKEKRGGAQNGQFSKVLADLTSLSNEELAALCVGYGPGVPFSAYLEENFPETIFYPDGVPVTRNDHPVGTNGYVSPAMQKIGLSSLSYQDGPAGIGLTAWPTEMLLACSFNTDLLQAFGEAIAEECALMGTDIWLGPALNLQRNPLGGRNFEYFSEDAYLAGRMALAVILGVQREGCVLACPKHFAANEQETFRRGSSKLDADAVDSVIEERTLRELYLAPFQMISKETRCLMTSFNKINGHFAAADHDLLTHVLREEWGFDGFVVSDWGDMDTVADGADAVAAGNDVVMPGGPPVIEQIVAGLGERRLTREELICAAGRFVRVAKSLRRIHHDKGKETKKGAFEPGAL